MSRVKLKFNRIPRIQSKMPEVALKSVIAAADELRSVLAKNLDSGLASIKSDTHALAKSLYVKATGRDDYEAALQAAREAYLNNPSRYRAASAGDNDEETLLKWFNNIVADEEPIRESEEHVYAAAVSTMLAYGNKLEFESEWMQPGAVEWAQARLAEIHTKNLVRAFK